MTVEMFLETLGSNLADQVVPLVAADVARVEAELADQMRSEVTTVAAVGEHTLLAGGKRLRPAFLALAARSVADQPDLGRLARLGACVEMIHMATLIHDDAVDHAPTRRGRPSAPLVFGETPAILSGDVLLAKAMAILADDGDLAIIRTVASAVVEMAEGEVRELETRCQIDLPRQAHFDILRMKTGAFIAACCRVGALVGGANATQADALESYGHHVGLAFQIADDLLDYRSPAAKTGKRVGTDFREGCPTLPLIALRSHLEPSEEIWLGEKFGGDVSDEEIEMVVGWMASRGAFAETEEEAMVHARQAQRALGDLPPGPIVDLLSGVAQMVVARQG